MLRFLSNLLPTHSEPEKDSAFRSFAAPSTNPSVVRLHGSPYTLRNVVHKNKASGLARIQRTKFRLVTNLFHALHRVFTEEQRSSKSQGSRKAKKLDPSVFPSTNPLFTKLQWTPGFENLPRDINGREPRRRIYIFTLFTSNKPQKKTR